MDREAEEEVTADMKEQLEDQGRAARRSGESRSIYEASRDWKVKKEISVKTLPSTISARSYRAYQQGTARIVAHMTLMLTT